MGRVYELISTNLIIGFKFLVVAPTFSLFSKKLLFILARPYPILFITTLT